MLRGMELLRCARVARTTLTKRLLSLAGVRHAVNRAEPHTAERDRRPRRPRPRRRAPVGGRRRDRHGGADHARRGRRLRRAGFPRDDDPRHRLAGRPVPRRGLRALRLQGGAALRAEPPRPRAGPRPARRRRRRPPPPRPRRCARSSAGSPAGTPSTTSSAGSCSSSSATSAPSTATAVLGAAQGDRPGRRRGAARRRRDRGVRGRRRARPPPWPCCPWPSTSPAGTPRTCAAPPRRSRRPTATSPCGSCGLPDARPVPSRRRTPLERPRDAWVRCYPEPAPAWPTVRDASWGRSSREEPMDATTDVGAGRGRPDDAPPPTTEAVAPGDEAPAVAVGLEHEPTRLLDFALGVVVLVASLVPGAPASLPIGLVAVAGLVALSVTRRPTRSLAGGLGWFPGLAAVLILYVVVISLIGPDESRFGWPQRATAPRPRRHRAGLHRLWPRPLPLSRARHGGRPVGQRRALLRRCRAGPYGTLLSGYLLDKNQAGLAYTVTGLLLLGVTTSRRHQVAVVVVTSALVWTTGSRTSLAALASALVWFALRPKLGVVARVGLAAALAVAIPFVQENYSQAGAVRRPGRHRLVPRADRRGVPAQARPGPLVRAGAG